MLAILILSVLATALAAPYEVPQKVVVMTEPNVAINRQIYQVNDDGSYTFGYEAADGTFRAENRDTKGYVVGRYGFVDAEGKLQIVDYIAGKESGKSVGFQPKGDMISPVLLELVRTGPASTAEQRALDLEYSSVDDDEDGMPDNIKVQKTTSYATVTPVVRNEYVQQPAVRTEYVQQPVTVVRNDQQYQVTKTVKQPVVTVKEEYQTVAKVAPQPAATIRNDEYKTVTKTVQQPVVITRQEYVAPTSTVTVEERVEEVAAPQYVMVKQPVVVAAPVETKNTQQYVQTTGSADQVIEVVEVRTIQQPTTIVTSTGTDNLQLENISIQSPLFTGRRII